MKVFCPEVKSSVLKPRKLWLEYVNSLKKTGVGGWRKIGIETPGN